MSLTFDAIGAAWWPYLFIVIAGALATDVWRWIGALTGSRLAEESEALVFVRAVATALVAGVIGQLILFPAGALAAAPVGVRVAAAALGWVAFWFAGRSVFVGVLVSEVLLFAGWTLFGPS